MKAIHIKDWKDRPDNFTGIVIIQNGDKAYYQNDKLHRTDGGPAIEYANGSKYWYQNGQYHRIDGPAIECVNGYKAYYQNGQYHRIDGPAIEYANGSKFWYILGQQLTEKQHNLFQKLWEQTTVDKTEKAMIAYVTLVTMKE